MWITIALLVLAAGSSILQSKQMDSKIDKAIDRREQKHSQENTTE